MANIEANLSRRLTLEDVAGQVGYSPHHFLRLFWAVTAETPGAYICNRRLTEAARLLAEREDRILDIALEYQYQSQAALTRSFKRPTAVTRDSTGAGLPHGQQLTHSPPVRERTSSFIPSTGSRPGSARSTRTS